ncbi:non-ribosomal peptide synthetase component F [Kitasatospora sp. GAS204A]|uniref:condensation domain-containing protein n=1 Tax=unclassified Kitasatospora TaxID=2633591 RepID=UPI00247383BE|nr:condensation domain-containing protein [Kitasatospora sp. GAS204B]MDH6117669.1 non-ribosomal peptide synthetase component F [Kitasatospora sp. GAS204B]
MDQSVSTPQLPPTQLPPTQLPLSVTQEAMWVTWQLDPAKWEHVIPLALVVDGTLELPRLRGAVAQLMRRHPALRARVARGADGMCLDWSGTTEETVPVTVREVDGSRTAALAAARVPFDLDAGPLSRVELLTGRDWTVLVITVHHITLDGASIPVLLDDLRRAYGGEELAPPDDLTPLIEYARRSREAAEGESGEPLRAYWREALAELPPARPLPAADGTADDRTGADDAGADDSAADDARPFTVDPELARRVRDRAKELGHSYFTVMLGALFVTLHHHTGSADLIISAPYHGRSDKALDGRVGFFVNVLPFRQRIRPSDSFADLLRELHSTVRAGLRHGGLPLPSILRAANLLGPGGRRQTHQVVLEYWNTSAEVGLDVYHFELVGEHSRCSLHYLDSTDIADYRFMVQLNEGSNGSRMLWKDATGSVGRATTNALARDFLAVLADFAADPHRTLAEATALLPAVTHRSNPETEAAAPEPAVDQASVSAKTIAEVGAIWTEVLRVPDLLPEDSFFELGGHSLIAATLLARINERLGVALTVRELFGHPRLVDIAELVDRQRTAPAAVPATPSQVQDAEWGEVFPAAGFQEGIWLAERLDPSHARYHIPLSWRVHGELDPARLRAALALLVARHEILRTRFVDHDGRLFQEVGPAWEPELAQAALTAAAAADPHRWLRGWSDTAAEGFAPADGRLLAAGLFTLPSGEQLLALCVHHLVLDGESVPLLLSELARCHQQAGGDPAELPQLPQPRQYRELVHAQQVGAGQVRATADLGYWSARLAGAPSTLGPATIAGLAPGSTALPLAADLTRRLRPVQQRWQASQFMVTAAALAAALHRWSGEADLTFGVPVANRAGGAFDEVLGPSLNTVVLRSRCTPGTTLADLLRATRESVIEAFEHQSAPFDEVVRTLRPPRTSGRTPYVDCMLNSVSTTRWAGTLGAARLASLDHDLPDEATNKFGLTVTFTAREDALHGTLAYRGGFLDAGAAGKLAGDLADLLNRFQELSDLPVLALDPTQTTETS